MLTRAGNDRERQVETAFVLALGRPPEETDRAAVRKFFAAHGGEATAEGEPSAALVQFCQALLNLNEFVYLE